MDIKNPKYISLEDLARLKRAIEISGLTVTEAIIAIYRHAIIQGAYFKEMPAEFGKVLSENYEELLA